MTRMAIPSMLALASAEATVPDVRSTHHRRVYDGNHEAGLSAGASLSDVQSSFLLPSCPVVTEDERLYELRNLLWEHAHPTLRGMDRERIAKLTEQILKIVTRRGAWTKWEGDREKLAERASEIWIPLDDLRAALNALPGPELTRVDVEQRIRVFRERLHGQYPRNDIEAEARAVFEEEKAKGTEFVAILGYMEEWYWGAQERLRLKAEKERREQIAEEKQRAETRLRNGADCPWTSATNVPDLHCCKNGRLYRLRPLRTTSKFEPAFEVLRVDDLKAKRGRLVGRYRTRTEATAAVTKVAYQEGDL